MTYPQFGGNPPSDLTSETLKIDVMEPPIQEVEHDEPAAEIPPSEAAKIAREQWIQNVGLLASGEFWRSGVRRRSGEGPEFRRRSGAPENVRSSGECPKLRRRSGAPEKVRSSGEGPEFRRGPELWRRSEAAEEKTEKMSSGVPERSGVPEEVGSSGIFSTCFFLSPAVAAPSGPTVELLRFSRFPEQLRKIFCITPELVACRVELEAAGFGTEPWGLGNGKLFVPAELAEQTLTALRTMGETLTTSHVIVSSELKEPILEQVRNWPRREACHVISSKTLQLGPSSKMNSAFVRVRVLSSSSSDSSCVTKSTTEAKPRNFNPRRARRSIYQGCFRCHNVAKFRWKCTCGLGPAAGPILLCQKCVVEPCPKCKKPFSGGVLRVEVQISGARFKQQLEKHNAKHSSTSGLTVESSLREVLASLNVEGIVEVQPGHNPRTSAVLFKRIHQASLDSDVEKAALLIVQQASAFLRDKLGNQIGYLKIPLHPDSQPRFESGLDRGTFLGHDSASTRTPGQSTFWYDHSAPSVDESRVSLVDSHAQHDYDNEHDHPVIDQRLVILFDLNGTLLYRPWVTEAPTTGLLGAKAKVSSLPETKEGHKLLMYHRPGAAKLFSSLFGRCEWGFVTSSGRGNAIAMIKHLLSEIDLQFVDDGKHSLWLKNESVASTKRIFLFDSSHCENDGGKTLPFSADHICQILGADMRWLVIITSSLGKARIPSCSKRTLLCSKYGPDEVCDAEENGLEHVRRSLDSLLCLSDEEIKSGEVEHRLHVMTGSMVWKNTRLRQGLR